MDGAPGRCWPPVPGKQFPSSMVPSILINKAQGSKLVIGGAGGERIVSAVAQVSLRGLWAQVSSLGSILSDSPWSGDVRADVG